MGVPSKPEVNFISYAGKETEAIQVGSSNDVIGEIWFGKDSKIYLVGSHQKEIPSLKADGKSVYEARDTLDQNWTDFREGLY
jgi:hypothetical protein